MEIERAKMLYIIHLAFALDQKRSGVAVVRPHFHTALGAFSQVQINCCHQPRVFRFQENQQLYLHRHMAIKPHDQDTALLMHLSYGFLILPFASDDGTDSPSSPEK